MIMLEWWISVGARVSLLLRLIIVGPSISLDWILWIELKFKALFLHGAESEVPTDKPLNFLRDWIGNFLIFFLHRIILDNILKIIILLLPTALPIKKKLFPSLALLLYSEHFEWGQWLRICDTIWELQSFCRVGYKEGREEVIYRRCLDLKAVQG